MRSERASAQMEQLQQRVNDSQREDLGQMFRHNVAWALADIEPATGGEHSEEEVEEDERSSHSPTPEQNSTPASIVHTCRGDKGKPTVVEGNIDTHHALLGYRGVSS